jgi:tight adherence protein B
MRASWWLLAACLLAGAVAMAWPTGAGRRRLWPAEPPHRWRVSSVDLAVVKARVTALAERPRRAMAVTALALVVVGWLVSGLVAGLLAAVYGALTARALIRRARRKQASAARARSLDDLCALAADLRAGLPPAASPDIAVPGAIGAAERRIAELTRAVWRLAERTGAPAADLVERIEADARTADRAQASAAAQAAGAQATALLLAALPLGGIALGYGIGVAPLPILFHTTLGGGCAIGAALLQSVGLLWADRLATGPAR